jgi:hypothetical protein
MLMFKMYESRLAQTEPLVNSYLSGSKEKFRCGENSSIPMSFPSMVLSMSKKTFSRCVSLFTVFFLTNQWMQVSPWMDNGTADVYVKKHPTVDRLKILADAASGKYRLVDIIYNR